MPKRIVLTFERGGSVAAELLTEDAPRTCAAVLNALPIRNRAVHAMWAGEEIFFDGFPLSEPLIYENETNDVAPGSLACIASSATRRFRKENITSFCIFYGTSRPRKGVDQTVDVNVFARVKDIKALAEIARRIRHKGSEEITITAENPAGPSST
jgi:hypothetical protein